MRPGRAGRTYMTGDISTTAALWWAVAASGIYHGINPGMGWPLAVSAALMESRAGALYRALLALAVGHMLAMVVVLLPFSLMVTLVEWQRELRIAAACLVIGLGIYPSDQPPPPKVSGPCAAHKAGALVLPCGHGAWGGADAGADLPWHLRHD